MPLELNIFSQVPEFCKQHSHTKDFKQLCHTVIILEYLAFSI